MQAMRAASATVHAKYGGLRLSDAQRSQRCNSVSLRGESIKENIPRQSICLWETCDPPKIRPQTKDKDSRRAWRSVYFNRQIGFGNWKRGFGFWYP
jgi:hypothetical protein